MPEATPTEHNRVETLDDAAIRVQHFATELLTKLKAHGIQVETGQTYLLNSIDHPITVPCWCDGIPIQMTFDAAFPLWSEKPRVRLSLRLGTSRTFIHIEAKHSGIFAINKVLFRFLLEIEHEQKKLEEAKTVEKATEAFQSLAHALKAKQNDPKLIRLRGFRIKQIDQEPEHVFIAFKVTHAQVRELMKKHPQW